MSAPSPATTDSAINVSVQTQDFDVTAEIAALDNPGGQVGAVVAFVGLVRDFAPATEGQATLTLEHYPGMTERQLADIATSARARWPLAAVTIRHRVGKLRPGDNIVLVLAASRHRQAAFDGANYIMDILKTSATFWKKEQASADAPGLWVDARASDDQAAARWCHADDPAAR